MIPRPGLYQSPGAKNGGSGLGLRVENRKSFRGNRPQRKGGVKNGSKRT